MELNFSNKFLFYQGMDGQIVKRKKKPHNFFDLTSIKNFHRNFKKEKITGIEGG